MWKSKFSTMSRHSIRGVILMSWLSHPQMAKRHEQQNNSSQMKEILQPESDCCAKANTKQEGERGAADDTNQAGSSSRSLGSSCDGAKRSREENGNQHMDEAASSCCKLEDLKRLPKCQHKLGPLTFNNMHTVLVDVSFCPLFLTHRQAEVLMLLEANETCTYGQIRLHMSFYLGEGFQQRGTTCAPGRQRYVAQWLREDVVFSIERHSQKERLLKGEFDAVVKDWWTKADLS